MVVLQTALPAAPVHRVGWRFIGIYALAYSGTWLALLTPMLVTIAVRVRQLAPDHSPQLLSLIFAIGAAVAMLAGPIFGRLSDQTTSRFGMRRPWLVGGAIGGLGALLVLANADSIATILVGWCLAQLAFNAVLAAIVPLLADQVPPEQRGTVSGILGICMPLGQLAGTYMVKAVSDSMLLAFLLPGVVGFMTILLLVATLPDRRLHLPANSVTSVGSLVRESIDSFRFDPRRHPDFSWAWLSRFLLGVGCSCINTFQPFYLVDRLGRSLDEVPALVFQSMAVQSTLVVLCSLLSGKLSDFLGHRKAFVFFGAAAYATGLWIVASAHSYGVFLAGIVLTGIGQGAYYAVDLALITEVLPDQQRDAAKDLGILNIANALPQVIAPAIGAGILSLAASNYQWLYLVGGAITFASACAILPVRSVR